jgi:small-conductance mechanosensitive channel
MNREMSTRPIDDFSEWLTAFSQPTVLVELGALALCVALALGIVALLRRGLAAEETRRSIWFGRNLFDGVLFPLLLLLSTYAARAILLQFLTPALLRIAIPVLMALVVIRVGVKVMQAAFEESRWVRLIERTLSWVVWIVMVLWVIDLLPIILNEMEQITWKVGGSTLSLRTLLEGAVTAGAVLIVTLWISAAIEARLLRSATGGDLSVRKAISNATRALLMFVGLLVALTTVGIDLTALSVLGGAIGVGIGFGLQKLAANYVSGFVILAERSMRIGDTVKLNGFEGRISDITTRYTVIRSLGGRESIVPNEMMITNIVENLSLNDSRVSVSTVTSVGYDSDVDLVSRLMLAAARAQPRVLASPEPSVALSAFGADGLEFTLHFWIADPENGTGALRSDVNLAILRAFRENGIEIPYPQRVVQVKGGAIDA